MANEYSGVLLIAHGMREPSGTKDFFEIVDHVRQMLPGMPVEGAFLEFARPTITEAIAHLTKQGASHIAAVPMFLSAFGHTSVDIPKAIEGSGFRVQDIGGTECEKVNNALTPGYPLGASPKGRGEVFLSLKPHVGAHERIVELSALRFRQALEGKKEIPPQETLLIIAAHGSLEPEASQELTEFAARRVELTPVARVESCFAVLGEPKLPDVLKQSASLSYKRIVIQPHLLLKGRYYDTIRVQVETYRREYPGIDWIVTEPLGPYRLLAQAVVEIIGAE